MTIANSIKDDIMAIVEFVKYENCEFNDFIKSCLDDIVVAVSKQECTQNDIVNLILIACCDQSIESEDSMESLGIAFMYLGIRLDEVDATPDVFKRVMYTNNVSMLRMLLDSGYKFSRDGNVVRQSVYCNKLNIAEMLLEAGYSTPEKISLFSISNQLSWDPERLQFLLDNGSKLSIDAKELECINIIYNTFK